MSTQDAGDVCLLSQSYNTCSPVAESQGMWHWY